MVTETPQITRTKDQMQVVHFSQSQMVTAFASPQIRSLGQSEKFADLHLRICLVTETP